MKLYYSRFPSAPNFGDDLNEWLWPKLLDRFLDPSDDAIFVGIGTILNVLVPRGPDKVVFGSGVGYYRMPRLDESWKIYCVRGPLTAAALGLEPASAVTDPALLVRDLVPTVSDKAYSVSFMPHHHSFQLAKSCGVDLKEACRSVGVHLIDARGDTENVLRSI